MRSSAASKRTWRIGNEDSGGRLRYVLLGAIAAALMLVSAAPAAAASFPLNAEVEPAGSGTVECEVEAVAGPCQPEYEEGTEIVLLPVAKPGYAFVTWFGCDAEPSPTECAVTMDEGKEVFAEFELEEVELWIFEVGEGTVECEVEGEPAEACEAEYPYGTKVTLVPKAEPGSEFVEWEEDCTGSGACELTMEGEKSVTAVFEPAIYLLEVEVEGLGSGTVTSSPAGINCGSECVAEYEAGETVTLTATAEPGSEFIEWFGCDAEPSATECEVTMDEDKTVYAEFEPAEYILEVTTEGLGSGTVTSSPAGINCGGECVAEYEAGKTVTLTAKADPGSEFVGWIGCDAEPSATECEVTMDEEKEVFAEFELLPTFTLEVKLEGSGSGTVTAPEDINCPSVCAGSYSEGEVVTLTAEASLGSEFAGWTGCDEEPSETECEVTMAEDRAVTATFETESPPAEFALTVSLAGTGSGTVTSSPAGIDCGVVCTAVYADGTGVTLTATPSSGSTFSGWSGSCAGTGSCAVTMSAARSVTATFEKEATPTPGIAKVASKAKVKGGKALLRLTCIGETRCKGTLKLFAKVKSGNKKKNLQIGKARFGLAAGAKKTLKVKLSGPAKRELAKRQLKAKVKGSGVRHTAVKLKLQK
ncbi:MAG: InlB B-repeat-containing protein [Chloroflexota bacterium]